VEYDEWLELTGPAEFLEGDKAQAEYKLDEALELHVGTAIIDPVIHKEQSQVVEASEVTLAKKQDEPKHATVTLTKVIQPALMVEIDISIDESVSEIKSRVIIEGSGGAEMIFNDAIE